MGGFEKGALFALLAVIAFVIVKNIPNKATIRNKFLMYGFNANVLLIVDSLNN